MTVCRCSVDDRPSRRRRFETMMIQAPYGTEVQDRVIQLRLAKQSTAVLSREDGTQKHSEQ